MSFIHLTLYSLFLYRTHWAMSIVLLCFHTHYIILISQYNRINSSKLIWSPFRQPFSFSSRISTSSNKRGRGMTRPMTIRRWDIVELVKFFLRGIDGQRWMKKEEEWGAYRRRAIWWTDQEIERDYSVKKEESEFKIKKGIHRAKSFSFPADIVPLQLLDDFQIKTTTNMENTFKSIWNCCDFLNNNNDKKKKTLENRMSNRNCLNLFVCVHHTVSAGCDVYNMDTRSPGPPSPSLLEHTYIKHECPLIF